MAGQPSTVQYVDWPIFNALIPKEGPKVVPFTFDWQTQPSYFIDLQNQNARGFISVVQTIWIDNSANDQVVNIVMNITGQTLKAPPQWQGYFPVMMTNPPRFTASSTGNGSTQISLMNVPFPAASWASTQASATFDSAGNMLVSDAALEGCINAGHLNSDPYLMGQNNTRVIEFSANVLNVRQASAAGNTNIQAASPNLNTFITSIDISMSGSATLAVAGDLTISINRAGNPLWRTVVSLPATGSGVTGIIKLCELTNLNYLGAAFNESIDLNLSAALTAGTVNANIGIGYTTIPRP